MQRENCFVQTHGTDMRTGFIKVGGLTTTATALTAASN